MPPRIGISLAVGFFPMRHELLMANVRTGRVEAAVTPPAIIVQNYCGVFVVVIIDTGPNPLGRLPWLSACLLLAVPSGPLQVGLRVFNVPRSLTFPTSVASGILFRCHGGEFLEEIVTRHRDNSWNDS